VSRTGRTGMLFCCSSVKVGRCSGVTAIGSIVVVDFVSDAIIYP
jgi:hypothetical protein